MSTMTRAPDLQAPNRTSAADNASDGSVLLAWKPNDALDPAPSAPL